jgi:hypothetical protein
MYEHFCQTDNKMQEKIAVLTGQGIRANDFTSRKNVDGVCQWH